MTTSTKRATTPRMRIMRQSLDEYTTRSAKTGETYSLRVDFDGHITCTCMAFKYRKDATLACKHVTALQRRLERNQRALERVA